MLHVPARSPSALPAILGRSGALPAKHAENGEPLLPAQIYIAPPDRHLLVDEYRLMLSRGPRENGYRPAVDTLFRSAAHSFADRVIAVVMSGSLDDGTAGSLAVRSRGGLVVVQDPADALYPSMPSNVISVLRPDLVAPAAHLGLRVGALAKETHAPGAVVLAPRPSPAAKHALESENAVAGFDLDALNGPVRPGVPAGFSCPDCQGTLVAIDEGGYLRFRCRVGHAWSAVSLLARQGSSLEHALWTALRNLEEKVALCRRMARMAQERGSDWTSRRYEDAEQEALRAIATIRALLIEQPALTPDHDLELGP